MKIHILSSNNVISYYFFYPLLALKEKLRSRKCEIRFFASMTSLGQADVLVVDNRFFSPFWKEKAAEVYRNLEILRSRFPKVIWADVTDSTGATQFRVLPYVDRYWKKQLLKNARLYEQNYYDARIYTDYYQKNFHLPMESDFTVEPLDPKDEHKLSVSWNLGLGPFHHSPEVNDVLRRLPHLIKQWLSWPWGMDKPAVKERSKDICFRGGVGYQNSALAFQRREIKKRLAQKGIDTKPVGYRSYIRELKTARIGISPFGAGEICFRDFEIMHNACLLFKPDMGHLETWPDFFEAMKTYVPFAWDFHDFDSRLEELLAQPQVMAQMADRAQARYHSCFSDQGKEQFVGRFLKLLN